MSLRTRLVCVAAAVAALFVSSCDPPHRGPAVLHPSPQGSATGRAIVEDAPPPRPEPGTIVPVTEDEPSVGDPLAPVTWVIWGDFECPFTGKLFARLDDFFGRYGAKNLRIVWRHDPLPSHESAYPLAMTAQALFRAGGSRAFWAFAQRVFQNQDSISPENVARWAGETGVTFSEFMAAADDPATAAKIAADVALGRQVGVRGTPASFINGTYISGAQADEKFEAVLSARLAEARTLVQEGTAPESVYAAAVQKNYTPPPPEPPPPPQDTTTVWKVAVGKSPVRGRATAPVTVVIFSDFQCPFCAKARKTIEKLTSHYGDKLRLVFKNNPLDFHPRAEPAATFAMEARKQGGDAKFWEAYDLLYDRQTNLTDAELVAYGESLGLRADAVQSAIEKHTHKKEIDADTDLAEDLQARGTPTFFINGRRVVGAQPFDFFQPIIDEEIARAEKLVAEGTPAAKVYDALQKSGREPPEPERIVVPAPTAANPWKGAKSGPGVVTVQIFSDFQCQFCKRAWSRLDPLIALFPGKVQIVFHNVPLSMHAEAEGAAQAAMEAFAQKGSAGFFGFAGLLFEDQSSKGLGTEGLLASATAMGLDVDKMRAALEEGTHAAEVKADKDLAKQLAVTGTPAFAVGDFFLSGAVSLRTLERAVTRALAKPKPPRPENIHGYKPPADKDTAGPPAAPRPSPD